MGRSLKRETNHFFSRQHYKHYGDVLANMCDERARMLQHQFAVSINHVHALPVLVSTFYLRAYPSVLDQVCHILEIFLCVWCVYTCNCEAYSLA